MVWERDATLEDVVRHVDYMVELVGIDHVAFGPDFIDYSVDKIGAGLAASSVDYGTTYTYPAGLEDTTRMPALLEALMERGYSREDVEKLAWRNLVALSSRRSSASGRMQALTLPDQPSATFGHFHREWFPCTYAG